MNLPEISPEEFKELRAKHANFLLVDVREKSEYDEENLGGYLIPLGELPARLNELDPEKEIIVHCKLGGRSARAVAFLLENGFKNVKNLQGGIKAVK